MGVFFSDMKMPETCAACPVVIRYGVSPIFADYFCGAKKLPRMYAAQAQKGRHPDCPAEECTLGIDLAEERKEIE